MLSYAWPLSQSKEYIKYILKNAFENVIECMQYNNDIL